MLELHSAGRAALAHGLRSHLLLLRARGGRAIESAYVVRDSSGIDWERSTALLCYKRVRSLAQGGHGALPEGPWAAAAVLHGEG